MFQRRMKNNRKKVNNANADILSTVSIVDGDEVVDRNNNEYIYLDAERGIIVQPEEVETVKNRQAVDVLKNLLLGSFNAETGKYEISNNIELELKEVVKLEGSHKGNAVFCESLSSFGGLGKLQFVVKTTVENGEALSQLYIFERVKKMSKTVVNTQIQLVAEYKRFNETYKDFDSLTFENYYRFAWEEFKIVKRNQMFYLSEDEKFLQGWIVRRKLYLKSMGLILDPYMDAAESELLLTRIEILSGLGTYGYKVLARFEELKNQAKKIVGDGELTARDQNEILEEAIETFRGKFEKEQTEFFKKQVDVVKDYAATVATVKEQNHKEVLNDIEVRMPTVVEIIKRDDEAKKIGVMARLDAEVASLEASSAPTTKQVEENAKQVAAEQKGKSAKRGKQTAETPANVAEQPNAQQQQASAQTQSTEQTATAGKQATTTGKQTAQVGDQPAPQFDKNGKPIVTMEPAATTPQAQVNAAPAVNVPPVATATTQPSSSLADIVVAAAAATAAVATSQPAVTEPPKEEIKVDPKVADEQPKTLKVDDVPIITYDDYDNDVAASPGDNTAKIGDTIAHKETSGDNAFEIGMLAARGSEFLGDYGRFLRDKPGLGVDDQDEGVDQTVVTPPAGDTNSFNNDDGAVDDQDDEIVVPTISNEMLDNVEPQAQQASNETLAQGVESLETPIAESPVVQVETRYEQFNENSGLSTLNKG